MVTSLWCHVSALLVTRGFSQAGGWEMSHLIWWNCVKGLENNSVYTRVLQILSWLVFKRLSKHRSLRTVDEPLTFFERVLLHSSLVLLNTSASKVRFFHGLEQREQIVDHKHCYFPLFFEWWGVEITFCFNFRRGKDALIISNQENTNVLK